VAIIGLTNTGSHSLKTSSSVVQRLLDQALQCYFIMGSAALVASMLVPLGAMASTYRLNGLALLGVTGLSTAYRIASRARARLQQRVKSGDRD